MDADVIFYEAFEEEEAALRRHLPPSCRAVFTWKTIQESGHLSPPARIVSTRTQSAMPPGWMGEIGAIVTRSTGYDHVLSWFALSGRRVPAAYLPDYAKRAVAEQAMLMWTALLRNLKVQMGSMETFHRDGLTGRELSGKTVTVVGVGRIGGEIVDVAAGLGMNVVGVDIVPRDDMSAMYNLRYVPLEQGLGMADIAVCALPLTEKTFRLLGRDMLSRMPRGGIFVNIARGEISPSEDLLSLLEGGHLSGVGLDVYENEKDLAAVLRGGLAVGQVDSARRRSVEATLSLMKHPRAVCTPHNAFNTAESVERKSLHAAQNIGEFLGTGRFLTPLE